MSPHPPANGTNWQGIIRPRLDAQHQGEKLRHVGRRHRPPAGLEGTGSGPLAQERLGVPFQFGQLVQRLLPNHPAIEGAETALAPDLLLSAFFLLRLDLDFVGIEQGDVAVVDLAGV
jgi:hypothetical protein